MTKLAPIYPIEGTGEALHSEVAHEPFLGVAKIQLRDDDAATALEDALGLPLPLPRRESRAALLGCAWLAPGEWLLTAPEAIIASLVPKIEAALSDALALVVDITHACAVFRLEGITARDALAAHCPLDLYDQAFPTGAAARSLLGEAPLFISRLDDSPSYRLIVDQTMAPYAWRMLAGPDAHNCGLSSE